ncbi:SRPBCC domain-containing protein [Candidatus Uabimicrobium sp. HlEnr_7]|uniref:SRPBCC family protein n=1 Tax=Candidatus Uabimicrobium helgolandensis TaxID=3095367 RepID=UPI003558E81F
MLAEVPIFLEIDRVISASRERVFAAWTQPEKLKKWWHIGNDWSNSIAEVDLRVGGAYRLGMSSKSGQESIVVGVYKEVVVPEKLVFTWNWDHDQQEQETLVTILLTKLEDNTTHILLKHENFETQEWCDRHEAGWNLCFVQLEIVLL